MLLAACPEALETHLVLRENRTVQATSNSVWSSLGWHSSSQGLFSGHSSQIFT